MTFVVPGAERNFASLWVAVDDRWAIGAMQLSVVQPGLVCNNACFWMAVYCGGPIDAMVSTFLFPPLINNDACNVVMPYLYRVVFLYRVSWSVRWIRHVSLFKDWRLTMH